MRRTSRLPDPALAQSEHAGFHHPLSRLAAEQRESLCRGVAFILLLAFSCLLIVYAPLIVGDPDWAVAGVLSAHSASPALFTARVRTATTR